MGIAEACNKRSEIGKDDNMNTEIVNLYWKKILPDSLKHMPKYTVRFRNGLTSTLFTISL